ncbi:MAG: hypothetical protein WC214_08905 [Candidatus Omnitrophota bacterium]|jgi:hypothetical protein|nr:hypothetical protein [Anaerolineaceae bacterium]
MSKKNKNVQPKKKEEISLEELRKPWIQQRTGMIVITIMSIAMMILVTAQIVMGSGEWGRGLLWGFLFGASIWLVFYGMNWFHSLFRPKPPKTDNSIDQK